MPLLVTYSILVVIWFQPAIIEILGQVRLEIGQQQLPKVGGHVLIGAQKLTWQYPSRYFTNDQYRAAATTDKAQQFALLFPW